MTVKPRTNLMLDALILIVFVVVMLTGLMMSLGVTGSGGLGGGHGLGRGHALDSASTLGVERRDISIVHEWASYSLIALVAIHLVLHWKWIVCQVQRLLGRDPASRRSRPVCPEP